VSPRWRWELEAEAADETDAAIVAEVLAAALRDERNDAGEPVEVRHRPVEGPDVASE
jgi:hypothetical protein